MRELILAAVTLSSLAAPASASEGALTLPEGVAVEFSAKTVMQYLGYIGDDQAYGEGLMYEVPDAEFMVREASIGFAGNVTKYLEYFFEGGVAACPYSGIGRGFNLMEAGAFFVPSDCLKVGMMKGHVKRGFTIGEECTGLIVPEKPRFAPAFSVCHPTGLVFQSGCSFNDAMGFDAEFAVLNGPSAGTFEEERDINIAGFFHTPLRGLSVGGYYNYQKIDFELDGEAEGAYRTGFGARYENFGLSVVGEYFTARGFFPAEGVEPGTVPYDEIENRAYYLLGGYAVDLKNGVIPYVQPHAMYQFWDKGANLPADCEYSYLTGGVSVGLGSYDVVNTRLMVDYETPISSPDRMYDEADKLFIRIQASFAPDGGK
jgi:hypothetical protein